MALQFANDRDRAEELVQEALVRAWTNLPRFQGGASFFTWVYRIMHNLNIDHHRRQQRRKVGEYDDSVGRAIIEHGVVTLANPSKMAPSSDAPSSAPPINFDRPRTNLRGASSNPRAA